MKNIKQNLKEKEENNKKKLKENPKIIIMDKSQG